MYYTTLYNLVLEGKGGIAILLVLMGWSSNVSLWYIVEMSFKSVSQDILKLKKVYVHVQLHNTYKLLYIF